MKLPNAKINDSSGSSSGSGSEHATPKIFSSLVAIQKSSYFTLVSVIMRSTSSPSFKKRKYKLILWTILK